MPEAYKEQFKRVQRWFSRFEELHCGQDNNRETDYYIDIVYTFFQNCFHLKDWLLNSKVLSKKELNKFISDSEEMRICRDLCNGSKHLILDDSASIDKNIRLENTNYSLSLGSADPRIKIVYFIKVNGGVRHAFNTAVRCVMLWEEFLKQKNLI